MDQRYHTLPIQLADLSGQLTGDRVQVIRTGTFTTPEYGEFTITREHLLSMKRNFDAGVRGIDLAIDFGHNSDKEAAGWMKQLELSTDGEELWAIVEWTPAGLAKVKGKEYRYLSADFNYGFTDNESNKEYGCTLYGAGLTNRPVIKEMQPVVQLADRAELKKSQEARSKSFGIPVLADGALTPPSGFPADADAYADPVNYKYPMHDKAHAANAHARFAQAGQAYPDAARNKVYERIVRKEIALGVQPSFDPKNPLDASLPSDIKDKLNKPKGEKKMADNNEQMAALQKQVEDLTAQCQNKEVEMGAMKAKLAEYQASAQKAEEAAALTEKTRKFDKLLSEGKLCAAQKEAYIAGDAEKLAELAQKFSLRAAGDGGTGAGPDVGDAKSAAKRIMELADQYVKDGKVSDLAKGRLLARKEHPELVEALNRR